MTFPQKKRLIPLLILAAMIVAVAGCSKLTAKNFEKIESGMTFAEVKDLIGDPTSCDSLFSMKRCAWKSGQTSIDIKFLDNQVVMFSAQNL